MTITSAAEWLEGQADRAFARQRAEADTAKLVATFAVAVSSALVASGLQTGSPTRLDSISAVVLGIAVALTVLVTLTDRLTEADHKKVLVQSATLGWDASTLLAELRAATLAAVEVNAGVLRVVRALLALQLVASTGAGVVASVSLLHEPPPAPA